MQTGFKRFALLALLLPGAIAIVTACKESATDDETNDELAQIAGDVMDSIDVTMENSFVSSRRFDGSSRAACSTIGFSDCDGGVRTRDFAGCTLGTLTFKGTTTLTYTDATPEDDTCNINSEGQSIARKPNWTMTGARGWTFAVSSTGTVGDKLTWLAEDELTWESDGIRRVATSAAGEVLGDFTTTTTKAIGITRTLPPGRMTREGRVVDGGTLSITDNLTSTTCTVTPNDLTWNEECTCAVSGSVSGTCSNDKSYTVTVTGCGTGTAKVGDLSTSVTFNRCETVEPIKGSR